MAIEGFAVGVAVGLVGGFLLAQVFARRWIQALRAREERGLDETADGLREAFRALSSDTLDRVDARLRELARSGAAREAALGEQIRAMLTAQSELRQETAKLSAALRTPGARGRWGELQLRRVLELAGLLPHCDFDEQKAAGSGRPDVIVRLPGSRMLAVDAKAPLGAFLASLEAGDEVARRRHLHEHARAVRHHARQLAGRDYALALGGPELVVMFLPTESLLVAALEADPALLEAVAELGVVLATPTTLVALLRAVALAWRHEQAAAHAAEAAALGRALHDQLRGLVGHFEQLRKALLGAHAAYDRAAVGLEGRVLEAARRLGQLGAGHEELPAPRLTTTASSSTGTSR